VLRSTQTLSHLQIEDYSFDLDCMGIFVAALRSNCTVSAISFEICRMEKVALDMWVQCLRSHGSKIGRLLFEPDVRGRYQRVGRLRWQLVGSLEENMLDSNVIGKALLDMVIHSSVIDLDLEKDFREAIPSYDLLFDGMTCHESEVCLSKLAVGAVDETVVAALARFLPHSSHVQELSMPNLFALYLQELSVPNLFAETQTSHRLLLSAIQQNGSLLRMKATSMIHHDRVWVKLVAAYCQRNEWVPKLLAQSQRATEEMDGNESGTLNGLDLCLVPTILFVARQAPRMAPSNILIGLLGVFSSDASESTLHVAHVGKKRRVT
jgi:hypothetical protein